VKSGDSVWGISNAHGITMDQLIQWNNIKNNFVYPGQKLVVSNGSSTGNTGSNTNTSTGTGNTGGSTASGATYTVKAGDSVWSVSNKHGISMNQLIQWNNIKNNFIYPGQKLVVKSGGSNNTSTNTTTNNSNAANTNNSNASSTGTYTVKAGESVWSVANKNGITMDQLIQWNNIKNNFIYPGQKLVIKGGSAVSNNTTTIQILQNQQHHQQQHQIRRRHLQGTKRIR
jgi:LysM repeat protein